MVECINIFFSGFWVLGLSLKHFSHAISGACEIWLKGYIQPFICFVNRALLKNSCAHLLRWQNFVVAATIYYVHACVLSRSWLFATLCTVASQARIMEWVAVPYSRGSSQSRDWTCVSYVSSIGKQVLYHWHHLGSPHPTQSIITRIQLWMYH